MPRSRAGTVALWVAFVVVAIVSGWIAVQMVGNAVTPASMPVLTSGEVASRLTTATPAATGGPEKSAPTEPKKTEKPKDKATAKPTSKPSTKPSTTSSPKPTPTKTKTANPAPKTVVRTVASRGGSVVAACTSGRVFLKSWSPAVGYRAAEVNRGPATEVEVKFVSSSSEVQLKVRCVSGVPTGQSEVDDESGDDD